MPYNCLHFTESRFWRTDLKASNKVSAAGSNQLLWVPHDLEFSDASATSGSISFFCRMRMQWSIKLKNTPTGTEVNNYHPEAAVWF